MPEHADPPLGECPTWCEKPAGHDWEDEWADGPIRYHTWRAEIQSPCCAACFHQHRIGVDEIEQYTRDGRRKRRRQIVLDAESPTEWDIPTATKGLVILQRAIAMAQAGVTIEHAEEIR